MVLVLALGLGFVLKLERTICFVGYINVRHVVVVFYFLFLFYLLKFYINSDQGKGKDEVRVGILIFLKLLLQVIIYFLNCIGEKCCNNNNICFWVTC